MHKKGVHGELHSNVFSCLFRAGVLNLVSLDFLGIHECVCGLGCSERGQQGQKV